MLPAGLLRDEITIENRDTTVTASGTPNGGWTSFASVRAAVSEMDGSETYEGAQNVARLTHEIRIRYVPNVKPSMRVLWGDRILQIHRLITDPKRREIVMKCEERVQ